MHVLFMDLQKVFNNMDREGIWYTLYRRAIVEELIVIIRTTYEEKFEVQTGVRRGYILSRILFLLIIVDVLGAALWGRRECFIGK